MTALILLGWRLLTHSLCFPAPQEGLRHRRARALLHTASSAGPPRLHRRRRRAPWTKTSASWLQLGAFIAAAQQPRQRDAVCIYPTRYTFLLARREHGKLSSLYLLPLPKDIKCGSSKQIGHRKPLRKAGYDNEGITLNQPGPDLTCHSRRPLTDLLLYL